MQQVCGIFWHNSTFSIELRRIELSWDELRLLIYHNSTQLVSFVITTQLNWSTTQLNAAQLGTIQPNSTQESSSWLNSTQLEFWDGLCKVETDLGYLEFTWDDLRRVVLDRVSRWIELRQLVISLSWVAITKEISTQLSSPQLNGKSWVVPRYPTWICRLVEFGNGESSSIFSRSLVYNTRSFLKVLIIEYK